MIKSISFSQGEILQNICALHIGQVEADVTYGSGCFYKNIMPEPRLRFDLAPRVRGVIAADVRRLPLKDGCLKSVMFDPPFLIRTGPGAELKVRFGSVVGTMRDLWRFYHRSMEEIYRVLGPQGWLVFKCQDGVLSGVNNFTHCEIYDMAATLGFEPVDLFILLAKHRMVDPTHRVQKHARKFHSYFWVFKKRRRS